MVALLIGYARVSTDQQDLTAQRDGLDALGVSANRVYVDQGLTGTNRERPGLCEALTACREGDTLVVTKLDRLARSLPDARAIANELTQRQVRLNLDGSVYDPNDPVGRLLLNVLAMVAEALGVQEWMDERSLPLWVADPGWRGFNANDSSKARRGGLITRPLDQTLADTLAWEWSRERAPTPSRPVR